VHRRLRYVRATIPMDLRRASIAGTEIVLSLSFRVGQEGRLTQDTKRLFGFEPELFEDSSMILWSFVYPWDFDHASSHRSGPSHGIDPWPRWQELIEGALDLMQFSASARWTKSRALTQSLRLHSPCELPAACSRQASFQASRSAPAPTRNEARPQECSHPWRFVPNHQ